jgi:hypothetical protein
MPQPLPVIQRLRKDLADERLALTDAIARLRSESVELVTAASRLKRTGLDLLAGHPPVSLLLDNMHNLVFRRASCFTART